MKDTIFALSSGAPPAAIAVVRISGPKADDALQALAGDLPQPRTAVLKRLQGPSGLLDTALLLRFPGPDTATGENLAELHLHGGRATVAAVLAALGAMPGLRSAEPGEFTRRAFENGRMDLSEAEGLADLLQAETESQRRAALDMANGGLTRAVGGWRRDLLDASARIEAAIDFADEDDVEEWPVEARRAALGNLSDDMREMLANPPAERLRDGVRVAIAGPPNAGKSTLFNALISREAAITSPIPGTTRDVIEAPVQMRGIPMVLIDTAGLRDSTPDDIERIGIGRAQEVVAMSDVLIWLGDPDAVPAHSNAIRVSGKCDLEPPTTNDVAVSALTGDGLAGLTDLLCERALALLPGEGQFALNQRQRSVLFEAHAEVGAASGSFDLLVAAEHLRLARAALDRLDGRTNTEDLLDTLFGRFCIGK